MEGSTTRVGLKRFECFYPLQIGLTDFNFFQKKALLIIQWRTECQFKPVD